MEDSKKSGFKDVLRTQFETAYGSQGLKAALESMSGFTARGTAVRITEQNLLTGLMKKTIESESTAAIFRLMDEVRSIRPGLFGHINELVQKTKALNLPDLDAPGVEAKDADAFADKVCELARRLPGDILITPQEFQTASAWLKNKANLTTNPDLRQNNVLKRAGLIMNALSSEQIRGHVPVDDMNFAFASSRPSSVVNLFSGDFAQSPRAHIIPKTLNQFPALMATAILRGKFLDTMKPSKIPDVIRQMNFGQFFLALSHLAHNEKTRALVDKVTGKNEQGYLAFKSLDSETKPYAGIAFTPAKVSLHIPGVEPETTIRGFESVFSFNEPERTLVLNAIIDLTRDVANGEEQGIYPFAVEQARKFLQHIDGRMRYHKVGLPSRLTEPAKQGGSKIAAPEPGA